MDEWRVYKDGFEALEDVVRRNSHLTMKNFLMFACEGYHRTSETATAQETKNLYKVVEGEQVKYPFDVV